jgi:hypothetical protein
VAALASVAAGALVAGFWFEAGACVAACGAHAEINIPTAASTDSKTNHFDFIFLSLLGKNYGWSEKK